MGHRHVEGAVLVQFRASREDVKALSARARKAGVTQAEYLRTMVGIELDPDNSYSAEAFLRMQAAGEKELARRGRVHESVY